MVDRVIEVLFKHRPVVFQQGELTFSPPWPAAVSVLLVVAALAAVVWTYGRISRGLTRWDRFLLLGLRAAVLALLLFALLRPVLVVRATQPERNFLAVVVDDSRSMAIADRDQAARGAFITEQLGAEGPLRASLGDKFALRLFRFSSSTERVTDVSGLAFDGTRSHVGQALVRVSEELAGLPVSGIVLVSDGADTSQTAVGESIRALKTANVPVFTVGLGHEAFDRDVQIGRVDPPLTALKGATLVVDAMIAQNGYEGRTAQLLVEDEGRLVASQDVTLPRDGEPATVRVSFTLAEAGPRLLRFRVPVLDGEEVAQNNVREALVTVEDRREKILYIEGTPRPEMKFIRQAVAEDRNLQVVTLQRTADRKFLRLDIDTPEELGGGFPKTREELFAYRGLVLGSIEASAFTPDQLRMMADFVSERGGGLLALGGRNSFAEGGYAATPVAEALPVEFETSKAPEAFLEELQVRPTRLGQTHVTTQIAPTEQASAEKWNTMPPVTTVNPIRKAKAGAAVLLTAGPGGREDQVVLAYQRYGAGKALALTMQDAWLWRMDARMPVEDTTHQTLWRRLLRWLVDGVPERVAASVERERIEPGEPVTITAQIRDEGFVQLNDATIEARVISPSGRESTMPLEFVIDRDGEYRGTTLTDETGLYEIRVEASRNGQPAGGDTVYVRSAPSDSEYFDAAMRAPLLRRIAEDTGGRFYTPDTVSTLADDITYLGRGVTVVQEKELWDMPIVLILLVGLAGGEWFWRRRRGLA